MWKAVAWDPEDLLPSEWTVLAYVCRLIGLIRYRAAAYRPNLLLIVSRKREGKFAVAVVYVLSGLVSTLVPECCGSWVCIISPVVRMVGWRTEKQRGLI